MHHLIAGPGGMVPEVQESWKSVPSKPYSRQNCSYLPELPRQLCSYLSELLLQISFLFTYRTCSVLTQICKSVTRSLIFYPRGPQRGNSIELAELLFWTMAFSRLTQNSIFKASSLCLVRTCENMTSLTFFWFTRGSLAQNTVLSLRDVVNDYLKSSENKHTELLR